MTETLLLSLGNPLRGDDGVGLAVQRWVEANGLPAGVDAIDGGTAGLDLALTLSDYRRAVIVDAADLGSRAKPGEWMRFVPEQARLALDPQALSLHAAGLAEALALTAALGKLPEKVVIFGVQPAALDWSEGLSTAVAQAVPTVGNAVLRELEAFVRP